MQINGVDVATLDDIPATPTLQQVLDQGNTAVAGAFNTLTLAGSAVSILNPSTFAGTTLRRDSLRFTVYDFLGDTTVRMDLAVPALTENRSIQLPDADGVVALTTDIPTPAYKVYTAILTQTGTAAPVATVLENTLGGAVTFSRTQAGQYNIISSAKFGNTPPFIILGSNREPVNVGGIVTNLITRYQSSSNIDFWSMNSAYNSFIEGYGAINNLAIEIRVYN
jgi:hypothetical protein